MDGDPEYCQLSFNEVKRLRDGHRKQVDDLKYKVTVLEEVVVDQKTDIAELQQDLTYVSDWLVGLLDNGALEKLRA